MRRRHFLGSTVVAIVAGCTNETAGESAGNSPTPTSFPHGNDEPTVQSTPTAAAPGTVLERGEWHTDGRIALAAGDVSFIPELVDNFDQYGNHVSPPEGKLAAITMIAKNVSQETRSVVLGRSVGAWVDGDPLERAGGFDHPDYPNGFDVDWSEWADKHNHLTGFDELESGQKQRYKYLCIVPTESAVDDVYPALNPYHGPEWSVRWE